MWNIICFHFVVATKKQMNSVVFGKKMTIVCNYAFTKCDENKNNEAYCVALTIFRKNINYRCFTMIWRVLLSEFSWLTRCGRAQIQNKRVPFNCDICWCNNECQPLMRPKLSICCGATDWCSRRSKTKSKNYFHVTFKKDETIAHQIE